MIHTTPMGECPRCEVYTVMGVYKHERMGTRYTHWGICQDCQDKEAEEKLNKHLSELKRMDLYARIERIETELYKNELKEKANGKRD
jgi:hypothetical protein